MSWSRSFMKPIWESFMAQELTDKIRQRLKRHPELSSESLLQGLKEELLQLFPPTEMEEQLPPPPT